VPVPPKLAAAPELAGHAVITGARRSDLPPPAMPASAASLPHLPPAPADGSPTPLPPPSKPPPAPVEDSVEVDLDVTEKAPSEPPKRAAIARPSTAQLPAICTFGRFEILGRIAFGGMAEIFLGRESTSVGASRLLAIKRILPHVAEDPKFVEMFLDEARLAIQLSHPHICHIYEFGDLDGSYFIAMEWISGAPLGKVLRRARASGGLPPELAVRIIASTAEALHYAHTARDANGAPLSIVHRDVTPHNIMVSYDGRVKLLDFGIAKAEGASTKTEAGVVKGKFAYMSPQQCLGKNIDARADIFALGICLYETLTGKSLYQRGTDYETMKAVIEDPVPSLRAELPDASEALDAIVRKALSKSPEGRYASAGAMQNALEDWLASTGKAVTSSKLAELMEKLFDDDIKRGPLVDSTPFGMSFSRQRPGGVSETGGHRPITGSGPRVQTGSGPRVQTGSGARVQTGSGPRAPGEQFDSSPPTAVASPKARNAANTGAHDAAEAPPAPPNRTVLYAALAIGALVLVAGLAFLAGGGGAGPAPSSAPPSSVATAPASTVPPSTAPPTAVPPTSAPPSAVDPPPVARGRLIVHVDVATAAVRIGEQVFDAAATAAGVELPAGHYDVHVEATGRRPFDGAIDVAADETANLEVTLPTRAPTAPPGRLSINTRPWSKVYVGSRLLGTTPIGEASVPSGSVRLRIVDRDGRVFNRTVDVHAGQSESVFYDLDH
jgi:serine/threonine-protein kinase